jgi:hypothetical protein
MSEHLRVGHTYSQLVHPNSHPVGLALLLVQVGYGCAPSGLDVTLALQLR